MLVSIIVITYNSSKSVLETLESAYRQTYRNIELIVSDDCSTDNTFELCQQWVEEHKDRFVRTLCTQTPHNGGIVWNYNHALKHAQGEWIKYIAGDDILNDNCIERYVANIRPNLFLYACSLQTFNNASNHSTIISPTLIDTEHKKQVRDALRYCHSVHGSTLFFEKKHLYHLGGFDTRFPMLEDTAICYQYLINGFRIGIINEVLIKWRVYDNSVSHSFTNFSNQISQCNNYYGIHYCWRYGMPFHSYYYWVRNYINYHSNNNQNKLNKVFCYLLQCTNVVHLHRKFRNKICCRTSNN